MDRITLNAFVPIETNCAIRPLSDGRITVLQDGVVQVYRADGLLLGALPLPKTYGGYGDFKAIGSHLDSLIIMGNSLSCKDAALFVVEYKDSFLTFKFVANIPEFIRLISVDRDTVFFETEEFLYIGISITFDNSPYYDSLKKSPRDCMLMVSGIKHISLSKWERYVVLNDGGILSCPRGEKMPHKIHLYTEGTPEKKLHSNRLGERNEVNLLAMSGSYSAFRVGIEDVRVYHTVPREHFVMYTPPNLTPEKKAFLEKNRNELLFRIPLDNFYAPHCLIAAQHLFIIDDCYWTLHDDPTRKDLPVAKTRLLKVYEVSELGGNRIATFDLLPDTANTFIYGIIDLSDALCERIGVHTAKGLYVYGVNRGI